MAIEAGSGDPALQGCPPAPPAEAAARELAAAGGIAALLAPVAGLPGLGPVLRSRLAARLGANELRWLDLALVLPRAWQDTRPVTDPRAAIGRTVAVEVEVRAHGRPRGRRAPFSLRSDCGGEPVDLVFFGGRPEWHARRFPVGQSCRVLGRIGIYGDRLQIAHPQLLPADGTAAFEPIYPGVEGVPPARLRAAIDAALARLPALPEWLPAPLIERFGWPAWPQALRDCHRSTSEETRARARQRLAMDELLALQLDLGLRRSRRAGISTRPLAPAGRLWRDLLAALPFAPTRDQRRAMAEIAADLARPVPMARLLMGDVGSGKTLVAMAALLAAVEGGRQAALLAPTDLLARQHQATLDGWGQAVGIAPLLLAGGSRAAARRQALERLADGRAQLVIGTHALLQPDVAFADLALVTIDEQHRFGVEQRQMLLGKGVAPHLLLLSATPIPRSLLMTLYGDLATSRLQEKPAGRQPVATSVLPATRIGEVEAACARALRDGARIFWICPLVEEEEGQTTAAAVARATALQRRFGALVGCAHGRQPAAERAATLARFANGELRLLVATTVIEVGVDVPEATIMVIEGAERFGLAQLHQLRGRVGRGSAAASCLLLYEEPLGDVARERLQHLRATSDGFAIAEADLALRGPGEITGLRQSGALAFRLVRLPDDEDLFAAAASTAATLLREDPELASPRGRAARRLLQLHDRTAPAAAPERA